MARVLALALLVGCVSCGPSMEQPTPSVASANTANPNLPEPIVHGAAEQTAWDFFRKTLAPKLLASAERFERELLANEHIAVTLSSDVVSGADARKMRPIEKPHVYFGRPDDIAADGEYTEVRITVRSMAPPVPADGGWVVLVVVGPGGVVLASQTCEGTC